MNLKRIYSVFIRQFYLIKSNPTRLAGTFLWTVIDILMWGFISKYLGSFGSATFSVVAVLLGAIILWDFLGRIQQGVMTGFLEDVWSQNFINYFASPLRIREYVSGLILMSLLSSSAGFVFMAIFAGFAFGYNIFILGLYIFLFIFIMIIFGIAIGIFVAALVFRFGPSAEWLAWPIPFVLSIFAGVYYPISTLPMFLQVVAKIIPASYVFESMRTILSSGNFSTELAVDLATGFILAVMYLFVTYAFFIRVYKYNLNSGGIARFSAET